MSDFLLEIGLRRDSRADESQRRRSNCARRVTNCWSASGLASSHVTAIDTPRAGGGTSGRPFPRLQPDVTETNHRTVGERCLQGRATHPPPAQAFAKKAGAMFPLWERRRLPKAISFRPKLPRRDDRPTKISRGVIAERDQFHLLAERICIGARRRVVLCVPVR